MIKGYLENLVVWLFIWRLKMNASKCCYTIFSSAGRSDMELDLRLKGDQIPYNPNPVFLGITFDESLCFNKHFANLRVRALKRLNILKNFSQKSWHLNYSTLKNGSIFYYSFFSIACVSKTNLELIQKVQNRSIRIIYKLEWDSPTASLFSISSILQIKDRFLQLGARYIMKTFKYNNKLINVLISEYLRSWPAITKDLTLSTPLCHFLGFINLIYAAILVYAAVFFATCSFIKK